MAEHPHSPQARRSFLKLAGAAGLTFVLAACEIVPMAAPRPASAPVPAQGQPEPVPQPTPPRDQRNGIAVLVPLTGPNAGVGTSIANAAQLALADARGEGVRLTVYDTAPGAQIAAERAIADGNRLFLGPLLAEDVRAVAPVARREQVPIISFSNDITIAGNGIYTIGFNPGQSIERVVSHARSQGLERFASLIPEGEYGQRSARALARALERSGGRLVASQTYGRTPASLRSAAIRLNAQAPYETVLIADNGRIAMSAAATIRSGPSNQARILGTELWKSEPAVNRSGPLRGAWFAAVPDTMFDQLRTRYAARYRATPSRLASLGYDAVLLALRLAPQWRPGEPFPEIALGNSEGFMGIDGPFRFGPDGVAQRQLEVLQVNPGGFTIVSPALRTFDR